MLSMAQMYRNAERFAESEALYRQLLGVYEKQHGADSKEVAGVYRSLGSQFLNQQKFEESAAMISSALEIQKRKLGEDDIAVAYTKRVLATRLEILGRTKEAEKLYPVSYTHLTLPTKCWG